MTISTVGFNRQKCVLGTCNSLYYVVHAVHHTESIYTYPFITLLIPFKSMYFGTSPQNSVVRIYPSHFACGFPFPLEAGKVLLEAGRIDIM